MLCPVCKNVNLAMTDRQGIEVDYCPTCRGIWLDRGELDRLIERTEQAQAAPPAPPRGRSTTATHRKPTGIRGTTSTRRRSRCSGNCSISEPCRHGRDAAFRPGAPRAFSRQRCAVALVPANSGKVSAIEASSGRT